jgi:hypothetical protein
MALVSAQCGDRCEIERESWRKDARPTDCGKLRGGGRYEVVMPRAFFTSWLGCYLLGRSGSNPYKIGSLDSNGKLIGGQAGLGLAKRSRPGCMNQYRRGGGHTPMACAPLVSHQGACPARGITAMRRPAASRMNDVAIVHFNVKRWWSPSSTPHKPTSR